MPNLIAIGPHHWLHATAIEAFQQHAEDLAVWTASSPNAIRIPHFSAEQLRLQLTPEAASSLFSINPGFYVNIDAICSVEHNGRNMNIRLRGNGLVPLHPAKIEDLEAALLATSQKRGVA